MGELDATTEPTDRRARFLLELVRELKIPFGYEKSFRIGAGEILPDRFLVTISKDALQPGAHTKVLDLCRRIEFPAHALAAFDKSLETAVFVHFGFEASQHSGLYKVYCEQPLPPGAASGEAPVLLHEAFKWDAARANACVRTQYQWYPSLGTDDIQRRLADIYGLGTQPTSLDIARSIVMRASSRIDPTELKYLEVSEDGNPRRSFDLNVYDAEFRVEDLSAELFQMRRHYKLPTPLFESFYNQIRMKTLGHVAGGFHRDGHDFFNVYFGVEGRHG